MFNIHRPCGISLSRVFFLLGKLAENSRLEDNDLVRKT